MPHWRLITIDRKALHLVPSDTADTAKLQGGFALTYRSAHWEILRIASVAYTGSIRMR
jgi:hypothetical protein